tara:strand:- start:2623 stop:2958 length:336 start_codon:yes stop_codon:yes gene_type:complete
MFDLNEEVAKAHQSVTEAESQAQAIEARIRKIDGAGRLLPARKYGKPIDTAAIAQGFSSLLCWMNDLARAAIRRNRSFGHSPALPGDVARRVAVVRRGRADDSPRTDRPPA